MKLKSGVSELIPVDPEHVTNVVLGSAAITADADAAGWHPLT